MFVKRETSVRVCDFTGLYKSVSGDLCGEPTTVCCLCRKDACAMHTRTMWPRGSLMSAICCIDSQGKKICVACHDALCKLGERMRLFWYAVEVNAKAMQDEVISMSKLGYQHSVDQLTPTDKAQQQIDRLMSTDKATVTSCQE